MREGSVKFCGGLMGLRPIGKLRGTMKKCDVDEMRRDDMRKMRAKVDIRSMQDDPASGLGRSCRRGQGQRKSRPRVDSSFYGLA